jgi:hypothetical protein
MCACFSWQSYLANNTEASHMHFSSLSFILYHFFSNGATSASGPGPHYRSFTITLRRTTLGRSSFHKRSARRRDFYVTTRNTQKGQTFMHPAGFEHGIPASERS